MKIDFKKLFTHFIISTCDHVPIIKEENRERIEKYITGIVNNNECKMYAIYVNPDHLHMVVSRSPKVSEDKLATIVADSSKKFIIENKFAPRNFDWQQSAAAFSVSESNVDKVCKYVLNQGEHHKKVTFQEEYKRFIKHYLRS